MQRHQMFLLRRREFRLVALQPAIFLGYGPSFTGANTEQIGLEIGGHPQYAEQQPVGRTIWEFKNCGFGGTTHRIL